MTAPPLVGFSGGGDSLALLVWALEAGLRPVAAIVDHGLRPGSAADAAAAARQAEALGAEAEVLTLDWPEGPARDHARLRAARHLALAECARRHGARRLLLGHTADDQAETVWMRLDRDPSPRALAGLAAESPSPAWPVGEGLRIGRPLLTRRRAELRAALEAAGLAWAEDPANSDPRYTRTRARAALAADPSLTPRLLALAARCRALTEPVDAAAHALLADAVVEAGTVRLEAATLAAAPPAARARALRLALTAVSGAARLAAAAPLPEGRRVTCAGCLITRDGAWLKLTRDPGAALGRSGLAPPASAALSVAVEVVWDGRLALTAAEPGWWAGPGVDAPALTDPAGRPATLAEASARGAVAARWLVGPRLAHLAGRPLTQP